LGSIVKCAFTDENYNEYFRKEFEISPAKTDGDGKSSEAVESELVFEINKEEVNYLAKTKKLIINLVLNTFQSKEVILRSSDKLTIKAYCKLNYRVKI